MNKIKSIIFVLSVCLLISAVKFSCSEKEEKEEPTAHLKSGVKREKAGKGELEFYEVLGRIPQKKSREVPEGFEIILQTLKPEDDQSIYYKIGACVENVSADLDADRIAEKICFRYLQYKEYDDKYTYISVIVDISKEDKQILRQELNREFFFEEHFVELKDVTGDGKPELITRVRFSPDCSGCNGHRIYTFLEGRFERFVNLFNLKLDHMALAKLLQNIPDFEEMIQKTYLKKSKSDFPCGYYESCVSSIPWIVDLDDDNQPEVILLVNPPADTDSNTDKNHHLFFAEFSRTGELAGYNLHRIDLECCEAWVDVLGFLRTQDKHTHLLINLAYVSTNSANPVLNIFDAQPTDFYKIGEFAGFYEHVIAERLQDLNQDGNTEIIYVGESYWPPGAAHADIVPFFDIAEYRNGRYVEANDKFKKLRDRLNDFREKLQKK